jgi:hypothetical protein
MCSLSLFGNAELGGASKLNVVYARFERDEPFSFDLFDGFSSLRVLTYSVSIPMTVRMLDRFDTVDCVFGYEGILHDFSDILACQKVLTERLMTAVKGLDDEKKRRIVAKIADGKASFRVVKGAIAHAKIYLLESDRQRRVIVGSANLSDRAFSGKQAETLIAFDDDDAAWGHYMGEYEAVRRDATTEVALDEIERQEVAFEEIPLLKEAENSKTGVTLFVHTDPDTASIPTVIRSVERLASDYKPVAQVAKAQKGKLLLSRDIVGKTVRLVKSQTREEKAQDPTWFSIQAEGKKALLSGREISLVVDAEDVRADARRFIEYFANFHNGFLGDVAQHQRDFFMFMCWLYASPFICDLRNHAATERDYIFDYPLFAILYGKSNCGKTRLIETVMKSMFGYYQFVDKGQFTRGNLRGLLHTTRRFPVVFDDIERTRFAQHASDVIKDETFVLPEYPAFVLSMNAEDHSFSTEIRKRCFILYTQASLPDNSDEARRLYRSVQNIQNDVTTALYREYLKRCLERFADEPYPRDLLQFSSEVLTGIFAEAGSTALPAWCAVSSIQTYQERKYEKVQRDLRKLYETNPDIWEVRSQEVILSVQQNETFAMRKEIPDWILKEGSRAGKLVLDRKPLEDFMAISFQRRAWWPFARP